MANITEFSPEGINTDGVAALRLSMTIMCFLPIIWYMFGAVRSSVYSPLSQYPGPFLAKWTRLWHMYHAWRGASHLRLKQLHDRYGPIVRIGPNLLDVDLPEIIKDLYGFKDEWCKTESYHVSSNLVNGQILYNLFSETDIAKHAAARRPVAKFYSAASVTALEPHMDQVTLRLCAELERRFMAPTKAFDISIWIKFYTWDVMGAVTFSKTLGYLEKGQDFDKTLQSADKAMDYFAAIHAMPFLDFVLDKNPLIRLGPPSFLAARDMAVSRLVSRYQGNDEAYHDADTPDFLDRFIEAKQADSDHVDDGQVISWLMTNLVAGADTTSILIVSIVYHSLRKPAVWERLVTEIRETIPVDSVPPTYKDARALPYLEAVVREASRVHPPIGMTLQRDVPEGGFNLPGGQHVPQGTAIGMNPYIVNRNRSVYGERPEDFCPERWLLDEDGGETEDLYKARLNVMNKADLSFGQGSRNCMGKNMALWETSKLICTLLVRYDLELADPEWKLTNSWFVRQENVIVKMTPRA